MSVLVKSGGEAGSGPVTTFAFNAYRIGFQPVCNVIFDKVCVWEGAENFFQALGAEVA